MKLNKWLFVAGLFALIIVPSAASAQGVLFVANNNVGIFTDNPTFPLHIVKTTAGNQQMIRLVNNGAPFMVYEDTSNGESWALQPTTIGTTFTIANLGVPGGQLLLSSTGNLTIQGTLTEGSSRAIKKNFESLSGQEVLQKVVDLPIVEWSYETNDNRHVGPMAEDFYGTFGLGDSETGLAPRDLAGVTLVALQGLNEVVEEKDAQIEQLSAELAELRSMVEALTDR